MACLSAWVVVAASLAACSPHTRVNPRYCDPDAGAGTPAACSHGQVCQPTLHRCVAVEVDAGTDSPVDRNGDATASADQVLPTDAGSEGGDGSGDDGGEGDGKDAVGPLSCPPCSGATPICDSSSGRCTACAVDMQCARLDAEVPLCATGGGACVVCNNHGDCGARGMAKPFCLGNACVACLTSEHCSEAAPVCGADHVCGPCTSNAQCGSLHPAAPVCSLTEGGCVECTQHADCKSPTKPACGSDHHCKACASDKECADKLGPNPGVCMFHTDGHCATDAEVLYVKPTMGACSDNAGAGTATTPFCATQVALAAASLSKPVIVIRPGTLLLERWVYSTVAGVDEVTVIGQEGATIGPATGVGITVNSGKIYIRGLRVAGMVDAGVSVRPGVTSFRMNRCFITGNAGGLFVNGAGFEISNSVFAKNGLVSIPNGSGAAIDYAGAYLGGVLGSPAVFRNNTVVDNDGPGVVCASGAQSVKRVLVAGNMNAQVVTCGIDQSSGIPLTGAVYDPKFDTRDPKNPYRLTSFSPCVDIGGPADDLKDDIDGNPRPSPVGGVTDCGAHELQK